MTANPLLMPQPHPSLPDRVYAQLRQAILSGVFRPGDVLRQEEIARSLGVSRAPLREALPRLEAEGVVVLNPRRGYSVVSLDPAEIEEIFELRALVEARAARVATERRSAQDVERVRALYERMNSPDATADMNQWFELNMRLHEALMAPSGLKHFVRTASSLRAVVEPYIRVEVRLTGDVVEAQAEHLGLIEAFAAGDAQRVGQLTAEHTQHTAARLVRALKAGGTRALPSE